MNSKNFAIFSSLTGVVSLIGMGVLILHQWIPESILRFLLNQYRLVYGSIFILAIISIGLGIIGIKSEKKILAICGIFMGIVVLIKVIPAFIFIFFYNP